MKNRNGRIIVIQVVLVILMSAAASYCLLGLVPNIGVRVFLIFLGLTVFGGITIFFTKISPLLFSIPTLVMSLGMILKYNMLDLGTIRYQGFQARGDIYTDLIPELNFPAALGLGLFLILGYLALSHLHSIQKDYQAMASGEAEINEVEEVTHRNITIVWIILATSVVVAVVVAFLLRAVQPAITEYLRDYPWSVMVLGLAAVLLIAGFLYWLGTKNSTLP